MEALIYNESPIAEYLEGDAISFEPADPPSPPHDCALPTFAPRGLPKLRDRLRTIRRTAASVTDVANERFLEQFRYVIVASQLLSDEPKPKRQIQNDPPSTQNTFSLRGALITAGVSFSVAWSLHLLQRGYQTPHTRSSSWSKLIIDATLFFAACSVLFWFARRQYLDFVRRSAGSALGKAVASSHNYDGIAMEALRFVQEVEVVSRGYEISHPLPPVSRLEDVQSPSRCRELRSTLGHVFTSSIIQCVQTHNNIQSLVRDVDLRRYHDIYDVSMQDYADAVAVANDTPPNMCNSLNELRFLLRLYLVARKVMLCDLLALHSGSTWHNIYQWREICQYLDSLDGALGEASQQLHQALVEAEYGQSQGCPVKEEMDSETEGESVATTPHKRHTNAQMRRFEAVANNIRSLNAKVHLLREEIASMKNSDDPSLGTTVTRHYEQLGADLRQAVIEWERGRNTMYLNVGTGSDRRLSRASSGIRSPSSPSPSSLGGFTVVEGGPAEALKLLAGDERSSSDGAGMDEEVFEAVALPRKRMSWAPMSREEKLNKLQEDRRKRQTLQEHAENTTSMLRELQMVIKHRPLARSDTRIISL